MARGMAVVLEAMRTQQKSPADAASQLMWIIVGGGIAVGIMGATGIYLSLPTWGGILVSLLWLLLTVGGSFIGWRYWQETRRYRQVVELQARNEVLRVEGRYKALVQYTSDIFLILNKQGAIQYASPSLQRTLGYNPEQIRGETLREITSPEDRPLLETAFARASSAFFTVRLQHREGYWRYFEGTGQPLYADPIIQGYLLSLRDVTDRKREEEQRREKEAAALRLAVERERAEYEKSLIEQNRRQLEEAYKLLERANHEIHESLEYAARIQRGMVASPSVIQQYFPDSFIFWRPRDVVSGDFYWFLSTEDRLYWAVADCTGHGVPGALMTMICNGVLTQAVLTEGAVLPDAVLAKTHQLLRRALRQDEPGSKSQDGMEIALVCYERATGKIFYAGANRPLWIARPDSSELEEVEADRKGIGGASAPAEHYFRLHELDLPRGAWVYASSDGFGDQFGGPKGKKYTSKRVRQFLHQISSLSASAQVEALATELDSWRGSLAQVDDILVGGIRV
ncbi:MAG: PAS domain S-box protein [Bacteroidia bacterium]|nr:PAS domain S-box protein [Bacteroidia bacterium]MDW8235085.1 PAS domain S-box protein [Bacteroidia bacterium]